MPQPAELKAVLAKVESTYNTDATPTAGSDAVQVVERFFSDTNISHLQDNELDGMGTGFGRPGGQSPVSVGQFADFQLTVPLKGLSSAFTSSNVPEADALLRAASLNQSVTTTSGSEKVNYTPQDSGFESATIYLYAGNKEYKLTGCIATVQFVFNAGEIPQAQFQINGLVSAINEAGIPGSLSYAAGSVAPPVVTGAGFTVNGFDPDDFTAFDVDLQTQVSERPGGNASDGHAGYWPTDVDPMASASYETSALGTHDPYDLRKQGTEFSWDLGPIGSSQYNKVKISGPAGRFNQVDHNTNNDLTYFDVGWICRHTDITSRDALDLEFQ